MSNGSATSYIKVFGDFLTLSGSADVDWTQSVLDLDGSLDALGGFITVDTNTSIRTSGSSITGGGEASVHIPSAAP